MDTATSPCLVAAMPSKHPSDEPTPTAGEIHKTTANLPRDLYEDLKLLAAIEPGGSFNSILVKAARELVERERETLDQIRKITAMRSGGKARR